MLCTAVTLATLMRAPQRVVLRTSHAPTPYAAAAATGPLEEQVELLLEPWERVLMEQEAEEDQADPENR